MVKQKCSVSFYLVVNTQSFGVCNLCSMMIKNREMIFFEFWLFCFKILISRNKCDIDQGKFFHICPLCFTFVHTLKLVICNKLNVSRHF